MSNIDKQETKKAKLQEVINYYLHFFEHPEEVKIQPDKPIQSAKFFSLLFEELPTHEELLLRTARLACFFKLNDKYKNTIGLKNIDCEPPGPQVEHLFASLIKTYEKLKELGFTYFDGKVTIIDNEEEMHG